MTKPTQDKLFFWFPFQKFLLPLLQMLLLVEKKRRTPEPSDDTAPRFIVQCYLFGWGLFLFLLINYPQKPIYLMSIICLISCRLQCRSRSVGLIISYGDVKELEIQLKYTAAFFPGFLHINKNTCSKNRLTQL